MMQEVGVDVVEADQCMFGFKTWGPDRHRLVPAKKPTKLMTDYRSVGRELGVKCDISHEHQPLIDGRAKSAARYPPALCRAICRGLQREKMQRCLQVRAVLEVGEGVHKRVVGPEEFHEDEGIKAWASTSTVPGLREDLADDPLEVHRLMRLTERRNKDNGVSSALAWDDLTGMRFDAGKVKEARGKEIQYVRDEGLGQDPKERGHTKMLGKYQAPVDRHKQRRR